MRTVKFAGILVAAVALSACMGWTPVAVAASGSQAEPQKSLVDKLRDAGRSLRERITHATSGSGGNVEPESAAPTRQSADAASATDAVAEPTVAQRRVVDAYAAAEGAEVERSVLADLDGDGKPEVLAEINWFMGNSHFGRLVVFVDNGRGLQPVARSEDALGGIQQISVEDGLIRVQSLWLGPDDARCCPSLDKISHYRWQGSQVVEVAAPAAQDGSAWVSPLGLEPGYYAGHGQCRDDVSYFVHDERRSGVVMRDASDVSPTNTLVRNNGWWSIDDEEPGWAVRVRSATRITLAIHDEVELVLCPSEQVPTWAKHAK